MCALTKRDDQSHAIEVIDDGNSETDRLKAISAIETNHESPSRNALKRIDIKPRDSPNAYDSGGTMQSSRSSQSPRSPRQSVTIAVNLSFVINALLLASKAVAFAMTFSYAVIAALVDSVLDILSQFIICITERKVRDTKRSDKYPVLGGISLFLHVLSENGLEMDFCTDSGR